jgi:hypothetical protein
VVYERFVLSFHSLTLMVNEELELLAEQFWRAGKIGALER